MSWLANRCMRLHFAYSVVSLHKLKNLQELGAMSMTFPRLTIVALFVFAPVTFAETEAKQHHEKKTSEPKRKAVPPAVWEIDNLKQIGGFQPIVLGTPLRIVTERGPALTFDGEREGLFVSTHPLQGAKQFTVEILFRPAVGGAAEQRFFHMQETGSDNRVMFETRLVGDDEWFLDTFIKSGDQETTLYAEKFCHRLGPWYHLALVADGKEMRHYVNGKLEMTAAHNYVPQGPGKTSIGMRINEVFWYRGDIREACFSRRVLSADEFHLHQNR